MRVGLVSTIVALVAVSGVAPSLSVAEDEKRTAKLKVVRSNIDRGSLTVSIGWNEPATSLPRECLTLVMAFQGKEPVPAALDAGLLSAMRSDWEMGVLFNNCTWIFRTSGPPNRPVEILQIVNGDGAKPNSPDFRLGGDFALNLSMAYAQRTLPRDHVQIGLFRQADPAKLQEASTTYRPLSNVVELVK